jgi:hypothetical protein
MNASLCDTIQQTVGELFTCSPLNEYTRIRTPFLYPDGDVIDVYLKEAGGIVTVTDLRRNAAVAQNAEPIGPPVAKAAETGRGRLPHPRPGAFPKYACFADDRRGIGR